MSRKVHYVNDGIQSNISYFSYLVWNRRRDLDTCPVFYRNADEIYSREYWIQRHPITALSADPFSAEFEQGDGIGRVKNQYGKDHTGHNVFKRATDKQNHGAPYTMHDDGAGGGAV